MVFPVAVRAVWAELVSGGHPPEPEAGADIPAQLLCRDAELAQVVRNREVVPEAGHDLAVGPHGSGETAPEELVRHHAIVGQPEWMRPHHGAGAAQRIDTAIQVEL